MRRILMRLCDFIEKKLYAEPTFDEMARYLDKTRYELYEARQEIKYLKSLIRNAGGRR